MTTKPGITEEANIEQAEAELSDQELESVNGGATRYVLSSDALRLLRPSPTLNFSLLRDLSRINLVSNKEWQE